MQPAAALTKAAGAAAPWREVLQRALKANAHVRYSRYLQVATVRPDGRPANRTVVYRGLLGESDLLTFVTDARWVRGGSALRRAWAAAAAAAAVGASRVGWVLHTRLGGALSAPPPPHPPGATRWRSWHTALGLR